jgi:hypothetical protein
MIQEVDAKLAEYGHGALDSFRVVVTEDDKIILQEGDQRAKIPFQELLKIIESTQPGDLWTTIGGRGHIWPRHPKS